MEASSEPQVRPCEGCSEGQVAKPRRGRWARLCEACRVEHHRASVRSYAAKNREKLTSYQREYRKRKQAQP